MEIGKNEEEMIKAKQEDVSRESKQQGGSALFVMLWLLPVGEDQIKRKKRKSKRHNNFILEQNPSLCTTRY